MQYKPNFPVYGARTDDDNNPAPVLIQGEVHQIIDGYIKLHEVPYWENGGASVIIPGYREVTDDPALADHFRVNYLTGRVFFHSSQENGSVTVNYKGLGSLTAVDEINWLWSQLQTRTSFEALTDTPDTLEAFRHIRVNQTATGLEFVAPTIGRSVNKYTVTTIAPEDSVIIEGEDHDIFSAYKIIHGTDAALLCSADNTWEMTANVTEQVVTIPGDGNTDDYEVTGWASNDGNPAELWSTSIFTFDSWNVVRSLSMFAELNSDADIRVLFIINNTHHTVEAGRLVPCSAADIQSRGLRVNDIPHLPPRVLDPLPGTTLGMRVCIIPDSGGNSPLWNGSISGNGTAGGGYVQITGLDVFHDIQTGQWRVHNNLGEVLDLVLVLGMGRDDICCSADVLVYEDVLPGQSFKISAPKQTLLQLYRHVYKEGQDAFTIQSPVEWEAVTPVSDIITLPEYYVQYKDSSALPEGASVNNMKSWVPLDGTVVDELGGYDVRVEGETRWVPGLSGPALLISGEDNNLRLGDSWNHRAQTEDVSDYANYCIGGVFKWVEGTPILFGPNRSMHYLSGFGGYYTACMAWLTRDKVLFRCGERYYHWSYPAGSWVHVYMFNFVSHFHWHPNYVAFKQMSFWVNGTARSLRYSHTHSGAAEQTATIPCTIGDGSPQLSSSGAFVVDRAYTGKTRNVGGTTLHAIINDSIDKHNTLATTAQYLVYRSSVVDSSAWEGISEFLAQKDYGDHTNANRYMLESAGVLYAYDKNTESVVPYSDEQPTSALWEYGMTAADMAEIPEWTFNSLRSTQMRIYQYSKTDVLADTEDAVDKADLVGHVVANANIAAGTQLREWQLCYPEQDFTLQWMEGANCWRIVNTGQNISSFRVVMAGAAEQPSSGGAITFTDLQDTVSEIDNIHACTLVGEKGKVRKKQYVHHLMIGGI